MTRLSLLGRIAAWLQTSVAGNPGLFSSISALPLDVRHVDFSGFPMPRLFRQIFSEEQDIQFSQLETLQIEYSYLGIFRIPASTHFRQTRSCMPVAFLTSRRIPSTAENLHSEKEEGEEGAWTRGVLCADFWVAQAPGWPRFGLLIYFR